jgi:hypothetical protein
MDAPVSVDGVSDSSDRVSISPQAQEHLSRAALGNPVSASEASSPPKEVTPTQKVEKEMEVRRTTTGFFEESQTKVDTRKVNREVGVLEDTAVVDDSADRERVVDEAEKEQHKLDSQINNEGRVQVISQQQEVDALKRREKSVRSHEHAHARTAGRWLQSQPQFETQKGPDGEEYIVAGAVSIDSSPVSGDAQATIRKMDEIRRAALAPIDPSPRDRAVALRATMVQARARRQMVESRREKHGNDIGIGADASSPVAEAVREQIHAKPLVKESESKAIAKSEEPGSVSFSEGDPKETSLLPLLDPLRSYQKNVEAADEKQETKQLKDVLI